MCGRACCVPTLKIKFSTAAQDNWTCIAGSGSYARAIFVDKETGRSWIRLYTRARYFSVLQNVFTDCGTMDRRGCFSEGKTIWGEADCCLPYNANVNNEWSSPSFTVYSFIAFTETSNFTFSLWTLILRVHFTLWVLLLAAEREVLLWLLELYIFRVLH